MSAEFFAQQRDEVSVKFYGVEATGFYNQPRSQSASSWPYLYHRLAVYRANFPNNTLDDTLIRQKVLPETLLRWGEKER
jgi:hypothetical protein